MRGDAVGVEAWFGTRTSTSASWCRQRLAEVKGEVTVSLVVPAQDEASTIGAIISALRTELVEVVPLVDELVVIDSRSSDDTAVVADRAGARVVRQEAVLPELGNQSGKGEALWKSLHVTSGDIVAFVDGDLHDFDAQFAVGLLGPLLTDETVAFVKAFYDRPLANGERILPAGGGRVTELVARPLLNLHWPSLSWFVQPLAGEYAARRSLLEQLPFVSGYGVEVAMLIDVVEKVGLCAMAQVDLGTRKHRNSSDAALGRMAAQVYLALLSRLQRYGKAQILVPPTPRMTQFLREGGVYEADIADVGITERPPMIETPQYRRQMTGQPVWT
jgi:glucosyl-3-phosphoglycerate synthase